MHKYGFVISAMLLTTVPAGADARKPFIGICEGIVQLGFFIDGKVSAPVGRAQREKPIGRYKCTFTDPEISNVCSNGSTCHVVALMVGGNQFQILKVFEVVNLSNIRQRTK